MKSNPPKDTSNGSSSGANPPRHSVSEPYDPLDNEYDPLPPEVEAATRMKKEKRTPGQEQPLESTTPPAIRVVAPATGDDEPFDPLDNEYGPPPPGAIKPKPPRATPGNDEPFDVFDNEYDPLPEEVVEQQRARAQRRRESFQAIRRASYNVLMRNRSGSESDTALDDSDSYDPLACSYQSTGPWHTDVNDRGAVDVYVDLAPGEPPTESSVTEEVDPFFAQCPPLNIVIFVVGSRGDVQPYLALALELIKVRGHRVRIATHATFGKLIEESNINLTGLTDERGTPLTGNLEFFDIGGDPQQLLAYMVKNPGLLPGIASLTNGDIRNKRHMVRTMLMGCYRACFSPNETTQREFAADAIMSNPPAFAHIHCAEALGIPLVMSFTMPWTPTTAFPHPLIMTKSNRTEESVNNYSSFVLADALMWQGLGDIINMFRVAILGVRALDLTAGPRVLERLKIPVTYAWSPSLLPKPRDWRDNIDVVGFFSMPPRPANLSKIDPALIDFLKDGKPPVYIGFGSIVVKDPDALTKTILSAVEAAGVRAIISAGWADIGGSTSDIELPPNILLVKGDVPHDWLFADGRVAAVCHHGGAGTTCAGLRNGAPTIVVPFFGDQYFWGATVAHTGAGPQPIPHAILTPEALTKAIEFALLPETREAAQVIGERIRAERGTRAGVDSFHKHLPLLNMRCQVDNQRAALWWCDSLCLRLSGAAAVVLTDQRMLDWHKLQPHRPTSYQSARHYTDPITAFGQSMVTVGAQAVSGTGQLFYAPGRGLSNIFIGLPKASVNAIGSFQEGLHNVPGMMGSPVRRHGKVTNWSSGWREGVKGLAAGIVDGVTGLVTEPVHGVQEDGVRGLFTGAAKSWINLIARPASGALGLIVHPTAGAYRSARTRLSRTGLVESEGVLTEPRRVKSYADARALTPQQREAIIKAWAALVTPEATGQRKVAEKRRHKAQEQRLLGGDSGAGATGRDARSCTWPLSEAFVEHLSLRGVRSERTEDGGLTPPQSGTASPGSRDPSLLSPPVRPLPA